MDGHFGQQRYRGEPAERRILIDALVDSVNILRGRLTVHVAVAPPFLVTLHEVGLTWIVNPWCRRADLHNLRVEDYRVAECKYEAISSDQVDP